MNIDKKDFNYFQLVYPKIIETIRLVASSPETQIAVFDKDIFPPDEIAEIVEHTTMMANVLLNEGYIDFKQFQSLDAINREFDRFLQSDWTLDALRDGEHWATLRELGKVALREFKIEYALPNLYWFSKL